jgi:hypothetical protein
MFTFWVNFVQKMNGDGFAGLERAGNTDLRELTSIEGASEWRSIGVRRFGAH